MADGAGARPFAGRGCFRPACLCPFFRAPRPAWSRLKAPWRQEAVVAGAIAAAYALYLLVFSEYQHLYYDAGLYWEAGHRFYQNGHFSLLAYDDALRGYSYPLLNFICLVLRKSLHLEATTVVKLVNAGLTGLLFGVVVGPRLWQASTGAAALPAVGRRLAWAALGFVFWRDYFNFSLSDFPAVLALGVALWQAQRRGLGAALLAGAALALALNVRPIYQAAAPAVGLLLLINNGQLRPVWAARLAVFALGIGLVLMPQWLINRRHFGVNTPLVLSQSKELDIHNLYLQKLKWGLLHLKYESSVGRELPTGQLLFLDTEGATILQQEGISEFQTPGQYLAVVARHPLAVAGYMPGTYLRGWTSATPRPICGAGLLYFFARAELQPVVLGRIGGVGQLPLAHWARGTGAGGPAAALPGRIAAEHGSAVSVAAALAAAGTGGPRASAGLGGAASAARGSRAAICRFSGGLLWAVGAYRAGRRAKVSGVFTARLNAVIPSAARNLAVD